MRCNRGKDNLMNLDLDLKCPQCGAKLPVTVSDVAKGRAVRCSRGHSVKLKDEGGGARSVDRSLENLEKTIRKLNGK